MKTFIAFGAAAVVFIFGVGTLISKLADDHKTPQVNVVEKPPESATYAHASIHGGYVFMLATVEHDGHKFVVYGNGGIIHHPDCPCLKKP